MLEVGIIGAGIAGFASAIALSRAGHRVEIFEKSRFSNETGAGIISAPNGSRVLSRWGFDFEKAGAVDCKRVTRIHADTLEIDSEEYFKGIEDKYGERWCFLHRADFHGGLQALAEAQHPKVTTHLGVTVDNVDIEAGIISLADGRMFTKDLVIVADGCRSAFIDKFIGRKYPVIKASVSIYRFMIPMEQVCEYPEVEQFLPKDAHGFTIFYKTKVGRPGLLLTTYPNRGGSVLYCGLLHPTKPSEKELDGWTSSANPEDIISAVGEFHPTIQAICRDASDVKVYNSMFRAPIEFCGKDKAILIGDAAHLMLPTHAQGACMALEDAAALEVLFANVSDPKKVRERVQAYNEFRMPRLSAVQTMSNKMMPSTEKMLAEVRTFYDGTLPRPDAKTYSKDYNDFFFGHDVAKEAKQFLRRSDREFKEGEDDSSTSDTSSMNSPISDTPSLY